MARPRGKSSTRWGSLVAMIIFFAIAITVLIAVPSSPINRSRTTSPITPGAVTLPPTFAAATATQGPATVVSPSVTVSR